MGIFDSETTEYLQVICEPCGYDGQMFAAVEGITCPQCGNQPSQVCYADQDSINAGLWLITGRRV